VAANGRAGRATEGPYKSSMMYPAIKNTRS
jgi:hypothetical protein